MCVILADCRAVGLAEHAAFPRYSRRSMLDNLEAMHQLQLEESIDPVVSARIAQYEMAYQMQTSVVILSHLAASTRYLHVFILSLSTLLLCLVSQQVSC